MITIREATTADIGAIEALLAECKLGNSGILVAGSRYLVAEAGDLLVGVVGLEYGQQAVLLRSAGVKPGWRGRKIGAQLFEHAYDLARADQIRSVYCFSTDAGAYWISQGFCEVPVAELCAALPDSYQVNHYAAIGWLPTEVAWRRDLAEQQ
jgi:N-acetylglutamate synthase-like GNAT family acetyltransferase